MPARPWVILALLAAALPSPAAGDSPPSGSPSDPRNFTWAVEGELAIGGGGLTTSQVDWLHDQGFRAIANFRAEHEDPEAHIRGKGMAFLSLPVDHAVHMNVSQLRTFVAWVEEQRAAGRPAYVHCTNGWHRAAAFVVAWEMWRADGELTFDEAAKNATARRPGTVMRAPSPLLEWESILRGEPGLTVMLLSDLSRPEPEGTMPVTVEVLTAKGAPAAGAQVKVWSEESGLRVRGETGPDGRFTFTYRAPKEGTFMDHLYARASFPGHIDGADNVELFYKQPVNPGPLEVEADWTPHGILVHVRKDGEHAYAHVVATAADGWMSVEKASRGRVLLPLPEPPRPVVIRAERWGADAAQLVIEPPIAPPASDAGPAGPGETASAATPAPSEASAPAPARSPWALAAGALLLGLAGFLGLRYRRTGTRMP